MAKKIHFSSSDKHDQPACKVVPDTTKVQRTKRLADVTCQGCLNRVEQHPWLKGERDQEQARENRI